MNRSRGLSPRGRGKLLAQGGGVVHRRSIPAWAGETVGVVDIQIITEVYPRVGGGNELEKVNGRIGGGLSPRGRGKLHHIVGQIGGDRSIPAWAGETFSAAPSGCGGRVYPRVGGGNHSRRCPSWRRGGLSPRGRGKQLEDGDERQLTGSIPAWAGETTPSTSTLVQEAVYPRVGGGNYTIGGFMATTTGLSPRGRGKRRPAYGGAAGMGSIPAWAGETSRPA